MYLVAHQDDCQMVVGNVLKVRKPGTAEPGAVWSVDGTDYDARLPRQCTCEPITVKLLSYDNWGTNYVIPQDFKDRR